MRNSEERVNILIVDDEVRNLAVLESVLDDPSYRLVRATSGEQALLALMADEFAVLVLDVQMPGMSGFALAQMVKERRKTARIPIIFLTAYYNEDQHALEGYGTGAVDYLHKPVNPAVLRSKVAVFAELHRKSREVERTNRLLLAEVAERRRAEARLSELNETLDRRVTERTLELQASEALLRESNQRKDEFLATLAHELRNPLAPLRNSVHFLKLKAPAAPEVQWAAERIDRQVAAMSRLIDDLMDISRINQGRIVLRREPVALDTVLADAIDTVQPQIDGAGHKLTLVQPPGALALEADPARLAQAFTNLLSNAAKYTDPGGHIEVRVARDGAQAEIAIRDTGIGMQPQRLETVFEMFSQDESALSRSRGGLGIGLALTRRLVELHGGSVTASSEGPGLGSLFVVRLPLAQAAVLPQPAPADDAPAGAASSAMRIVVADDNRDAAETLSMLLETLGHEVRRAYDGEAAVAACAEFDPQLVVLDLGMPRLNGYDACRRIRAQGGKRRTVVALSGWGQPQDLQRSSEAGFDRHLVKPVDFGTLSGLLAGFSTPTRS